MAATTSPMPSWRSTSNGKILALRVKTIANLGAYMSTFSSSVPTYLYATLLSGQYDIPQIYCEVDAVYTNTVPVDAYRGAGRPEATFVVERLVEVGGAARWASTRPNLRKRNFIKTFPHQTPVIMAYDAGDYNASLKKAMELADVKGFGKRKREARAHGKLRGIGYSTYIEACGIAPSARRSARSAAASACGRSAEVRVNPTGSVEVLTGSPAHGQGHETTFAQLVSERLGIPFENVSIVHGDTDKVQFGMGTYGSRSGAVGMSAIVKALDKIEAKAKKVAAHHAGSRRRRHRVQGRQVHRRRHRQVGGLGRRRAQRLYRAQIHRRRTRAGPEGDVVLRSDQFHLPGRLPHLRGRGRHRHRQDRDRQLDRGRRLRHRDQSDDRRRPGARRHRARHRPGAAGRRGLRQGRPARDRLDDGLHHAARARPAVVQGRPDRNQVAVQPARHQRLRRGRRDRGAGRGDQRHHRCDRHRRI